MAAVRMQRRLEPKLEAKNACRSARLDLSTKPTVTAFFDEPTKTVSYVVQDPNSTSCAVIDSVMDIDYAAGRISYRSANAIIAFKAPA